MVTNLVAASIQSELPIVGRCFNGAHPFRDICDFRSAVAAVTRPEAVQLGACPLLSLDTVVASSRAYSNPTVLSRVTAQGCTFAGGPAFTFSVEVEPVPDVDIDNHSGRAYVFDVEPIVESQSGPGEKVVTLVDTAFANLSDEGGKRYLSFFVIGDQAVTLRANAFQVNDDGWRVLADEVAANFESGAADGPAETVEVVDVVEKLHDGTARLCRARSARSAHRS
jgi:hypothetical protein